YHIIQLSTKRGAAQAASHTTLIVNTGTKPRSRHDAQLFACETPNVKSKETEPLSLALSQA
ncbi:MAG: hypothetical protein M3R67_13965, partial [Acidobacteriota bacterium]|nr:hypothetical protein [Acidobacteriota bacterium]